MSDIIHAEKPFSVARDCSIAGLDVDYWAEGVFNSGRPIVLDKPIELKAGVKYICRFFLEDNKPHAEIYEAAKKTLLE